MIDPQVGDVIQVSYTGYWIRARVLAPSDRINFIEVEQISGYEDEPERPRFPVAAEYCTLPGQPLVPGPFSHEPPPRENEG